MHAPNTSLRGPSPDTAAPSSAFDSAPSSSNQARPGAVAAAILLTLALALVTPSPAPAADTKAEAAALIEVQDLLRQGQYRQATQHLDRYIEAHPHNPEALFLRGVILARQGKAERAIEAFRRVTSEFPKLSEPYNNLAVLYARRGDFENARAALVKAVELQPSYDTAFENLGDVYTKLASMAYARSYLLNDRNRRAQSKVQVLDTLLEKGGRRNAPLGISCAPRAETGRAPSSAARERPAPRLAAHTGDCYRVGPIDDGDRQQAVATWLRAHGARIAGLAGPGGSPSRTKVYLPPAASRQAARERLADLKAKGLSDVVLVTRGPMKNSISLGVYSRPGSVQRRLEQLRALGYQARTETLHPGTAGRWLRVAWAGGPAGWRSFHDAFPDLRRATSGCQP